MTIVRERLEEREELLSPFATRATQTKGRLIPEEPCGIRTDFQGELFDGSKYLLAWADRLKELRAVCHCGKKATMIVRVNDDGEILREGEQIDIGGNEKYLSLCRKHFYSGDIE